MGAPHKKKKYEETFLSYISVLLLALLLGCEKDTGTSGSSPVCFYLSPEPSTRATDTEFEKGDAIGVFAAARDDESVPAQLRPSGNFADNKKYIFDGEKFVPDGESNSIFITSYPIDYYAYYPYATVDNPLEFTFHVAADQESLTESDLMYARNTDGSGKNNIPLTFIHKLSKVVVPYSRENVGGAAGTAVVNDAYTGCIMNLSTGEIRTLFDDGQQDIVMFKDGNAADVSFSAISRNRLLVQPTLLLFLMTRKSLNYLQTVCLKASMWWNYRLWARSWSTSLQ